MKESELALVKEGGYALYNLSGEEAGDGDRVINVVSHALYTVPLREPTLFALVLDRHAQGQYSTEQVRQWLLTEARDFPYIEQVQENGDFDTEEESFDLRDVPESVLRGWLLERHRRDDFFDEWEYDEWGDAVSNFLALLPEWVTPNTGEVGGWTGGEEGDFVIPADLTLSEVWAAVDQNAKGFLARLEPVIP